MTTLKPLLISLKDTVAKDLNNQHVSDAFRQIEVWSRTGTPPPTTSANLVSFTDPSGVVWVAKAGVNGGQYRQARDVIHGRIFRIGTWNTSTTAVQFSYDTVNRDPYGMFSTGGWLVPVSGIYLWTASITSGNMAGGSYFQTDCQRNGTSVATVIASAATAGPGAITLTTEAVTQLFMSAGDNLHVFQRAAVAVAGTVGGNFTYSTLDYLGSG